MHAAVLAHMATPLFLWTNRPLLRACIDCLLIAEHNETLPDRAWLAGVRREMQAYLSKLQSGWAPTQAAADHFAALRDSLLAGAGDWQAYRRLFEDIPHWWRFEEAQVRRWIDPAPENGKKNRCARNG